MQEQWLASTCQAIEVGCQGFLGSSFCKAMSSLGVSGATERGATWSITEAAEKATEWLWIKRGDPWLVAAVMQAGTIIPAGSLGGGVMMLKATTSMTPGTSLKMHPNAS